jgi:hypothetical protein
LKVIIDRFEGKVAVCEKADRTMMDIPRSHLPSEAKEGDVLVIEGDSIRIDRVDTEKRKRAVENMMKKIW